MGSSAFDFLSQSNRLSLLELNFVPFTLECLSIEGQGLASYLQSVQLPADMSTSLSWPHSQGHFKASARAEQKENPSVATGTFLLTRS